MSDVRIVHIGIREDTRLRTEFLDERRQLLFREDRDSVRIELPRERGRILPSRDPRNLRGGEGDDVVRRIVAEIHVEVVEVAARGAEDDDLARPRHGLGSRRECKAFLGFLRRWSTLTLNKVDLGRIRAFYSWRVLDDPFQRLEDPIKHRSGEAARLRVPLAWVVRSE